MPFLKVMVIFYHIPPLGNMMIDFLRMHSDKSNNPCAYWRRLSLATVLAT